MHIFVLYEGSCYIVTAPKNRLIQKHNKDNQMTLSIQNKIFRKTYPQF